jgi:hypothetical protein
VGTLYLEEMRRTTESEEIRMDSCGYTWDDGRMPRPATGKTKVRHIRIPDSVWEDAKTQAEEDGTTVSAAVVAFLTRYGAKVRRRPPDEETGD